MPMRKSAEDYLETILLLSQRQDIVRSIDIAQEMGFSKPSVSIAMKRLREDGMITVSDDGAIYLTDTGQRTANQVYDRHATLYNWLLSIGVSAECAEQDACRMEHILSEETFKAIKILTEDK